MALVRHYASLEIVGGTKMIYFTTIESPIDELLLLSDGEYLTGLFMDECAHGPIVNSDWKRVDHLAIFEQSRQQLTSYFNGELTSFTLPLRANGTDFQKAVWRGLVEIPYGTTINYRQLAERIGNPNAQRAVGLANGRNPIGIVVPCHRVIGANGSLTGYGGGLARKEALLALESRVANPRGIVPTQVRQQKLELIV
jgi:methylated-DNA-[protein]-cysteine S-methyltransferase